MPKLLDIFPDEYELCIGVWGQSNARPRGTRDELMIAGPELALQETGIDIMVTAVSALSGAATITTSTTLTAKKWAGATLRMIFTVYGTSTPRTARVGRFLVESNTTTTLSGTWLTACATLPTTGAAAAFDGTNNYVTIVGHAAQAGDRFTFSGAGLPPQLSLGTTYYVQQVIDPDNFTIAESFGGAAKDFDTAASGPTVNWSIGAYIGLDPSKRTYPSVRVLTPFSPEAPGDYPDGAPGDLHDFEFPADVTTYEDAAVFLPFTYAEGIEGIGVTGTSISSISSLTVTFGGSPLSANMFDGGYVSVVMTDGRRWYGTIDTNDSNSCDVEAWHPNSVPTGTVQSWEVWVPHWRDNPHAATPGEGFRYPSNDMMPASLSSGNVGKTYNRPKGQMVPGYVTVQSSLPRYKAGAMLPLAWRLSQLLGRRINVVYLAVDSAFLMQVGQFCDGTIGAAHTIGWWKDTVHLDFSPGHTPNLASRYQRVLENQVQNALIAEGSTKKAKFISFFGLQGESESTSEVGRELYPTLLQTFYAWLRKVVTDAGMNPFRDTAKIPCLHAKLPLVPWRSELAGYDTDVDGEINAAIDEWVAKDGFAGSIDTDDSEHGADILHFNGAGEYRNGTLFADAAIDLIARAAAWGGLDSPIAVDICNEALTTIGDAGMVVSIDPTDGTTQADLCALRFPQARDYMLASHRWSFAAKRVELVEVTNTRDEFEFAYAVPADLMTPTSVRPAGTPDDTSLEDLEIVYEHQRPPNPADLASAYSIEVDADGVRVLYSNVEDAVLRYQAHVADASQWPPLVRQAIVWKLAAMLAGPLIKGDAGAAEKRRCEAFAVQALQQARSADQARRRVRPQHRAPWHRR